MINMGYCYTIGEYQYYQPGTCFDGPLIVEYNRDPKRFKVVTPDDYDSFLVTILPSTVNLKDDGHFTNTQIDNGTTK